MNCIQFTDSRSFLDETEEIFLEQESLYGLLHGISISLLDNPLQFGSQPFFAVVKEQGVVQVIALMTPPHKLQVMARTKEPEKAMAMLATALRDEEWSVPAVMGDELAATAFARSWGKPFRAGMKQRLMECRQVRAGQRAQGFWRGSKPEDAALLREWMVGFHQEAFGPNCPGEKIELALRRLNTDAFFFWLAPHPVCTACYTRPTETGVCVSFVYTPEEERRNGYASALVAAITSEALEQGKKYCSLYTDLANPTSNSIYEKIGYEKIVDLVDLEFEPQ